MRFFDLSYVEIQLKIDLLAPFIWAAGAASFLFCIFSLLHCAIKTYADNGGGEEAVRINGVDSNYNTDLSAETSETDSEDFTI